MHPRPEEAAAAIGSGGTGSGGVVSEWLDVKLAAAAQSHHGHSAQLHVAPQSAGPGAVAPICPPLGVALDGTNT